MTSELDLPLLPSAEQIRRREFATVRRGYDPDQVREYLGQVATQVETLEKGLREAKLQADASGKTPGEVLAGKMASETTTPTASAPIATEDAYGRLTQRFGRMIESADKEATAVVDEAKTDASRILGEARSEADRVRLDAQARAEEARQQGSEALAKAKIEADAILGSLAGRRESLVSQMQEMQTKLLSVAKDLETAMDEREAITSSSSSSAPSRDATRPGSGRRDDEVVDPRYEDLWASASGGGSGSQGGKDSTIDIPDLAPIDLDFDDDARGSD